MHADGRIVVPLPVCKHRPLKRPKDTAVQTSSISDDGGRGASSFQQQNSPFHEPALIAR